MTLNEEIKKFIQGLEGLPKGGKAYLLENETRYTIGYGHVITDEEVRRGYLELNDGSRVQLLPPGGRGEQTVLTLAQAVSLFDKDIPRYVAGTTRVVPAAVWSRLSDTQKAALVSYTYNAGPGSTASRTGFAGFYNGNNGFKQALESGNYQLAGEILRDKGVRTSGGVIVPTLISRRRIEGGLVAGKELAQSLFSNVGDFEVYYQTVYRKPFTDGKDPELLSTLNDVRVLNTPLQEFILNSAIKTESQLQGEIELLSGIGEVSLQVQKETNAIESKIAGFSPLDAQFLVQNNLFEFYPDRMRQQMSANAGDGAVKNYSHAWRSPGKLAITANITIPGAAGFRIGQIFWVGRTYEHYKKYGAFQLFGLTETIDTSRGWVTEIYSRFNAMPEIKLVGLQSE